MNIKSKNLNYLDTNFIESDKSTPINTDELKNNKQKKDNLVGQDINNDNNVNDKMIKNNSIEKIKIDQDNKMEFEINLLEDQLKKDL